LPDCRHYARQHLLAHRFRVARTTISQALLLGIPFESATFLKPAVCHASDWRCSRLGHSYGRQSIFAGNWRTHDTGDALSHLTQGTSSPFTRPGIAFLFLCARVSLILLLATALAPAAHADAAGDYVGLVDIGGGRKIYLECRGTGSPTVVLVAGLRGSADDWTIADKQLPAVFPEVSKFTRVCAYDRPGTPVGEKPSRSDPVPQPTTAKDAVADLHSLLRAANEAGPYVLVGHSYGGLIVRLYASTYPQDVSGLVLVDALSEGLEDAETPQEWPIQRKLIEGDVKESLVEYPALERIDVDRSFDEIRRAPRLHPLPLVVLSADRPWGPQIPSMIASGALPADVPPNFGYITDAAQKRAQEKLARLVPNAKHITNTKSGHEIQKEQPQLVVDAIREVVDAVRSRKLHPSK
jgi:pimeloyl-ACP methyl ester carboxylesterase